MWGLIENGFIIRVISYYLNKNDSLINMRLYYLDENPKLTNMTTSTNKMADSATITTAQNEEITDFDTNKFTSKKKKQNLKIFPYTIFLF